MDHSIIVAIISGCFMVLVAVMNMAQNHIQHKKTVKMIEDNATLQEEALKQLLGNAIDDMYFKYKEKGEIPISARKNLEEIYKAYSKLHGNGERERHYLYINGLPVIYDK